MRVSSNIACLAWAVYALIVFDTASNAPTSLGFVAKVRYYLFRPQVLRWFVRLLVSYVIETGIGCLEDWKLPTKRDAHPIGFLVFYAGAVLISTGELIAKGPSVREIAKMACMDWLKENNPEKYALMCARDAEARNQKHD